MPSEAPEEAADLAGEAFEKVVAVMRGEVSGPDATGILKAATYVRTEICGPVAQKLEHSGEGGGPLRVSIQINTRKKADNAE